MFDNLIFLLQTICGVAFCFNIDELYPALKNRYPLSAFLYSADNVGDLQYMANINQNRYCDRNADEKNVIRAISIPAVINETTCLKVNEASNATSRNLVAYQQVGEWTISGLNGFCTASTDEDLCGILAGKTFAYPMAQWVPLPHDKVVALARNGYVNRFYSHYWFLSEQISLPQQLIEEFVDRYFEQREERRKSAQYEDFKKFQTVRASMGW